MTIDLLNIATRNATRPVPVSDPFVTIIPAGYVSDRPVKVVTFPNDGIDFAALHNARVESLYRGERVHTFNRPDGKTVVAGISDGNLVREYPFKMSSAAYSAWREGLDMTLYADAARNVTEGRFTLDFMNRVIVHNRRVVTPKNANVTSSNVQPVYFVEVRTGGRGRPSKIYPYITPDTTASDIGRSLTKSESDYRKALRKASKWHTGGTSNVKGAESPQHSWAAQSVHHTAAGQGAR